MTLGSANSERALNVLIGRPESGSIATLTEIPHQHDDDLLAARPDMSGHRDVRALRGGSEMAHQQGRQAYRWWAPSLDLYAGYGLYTLRERDFVDRADRYEPVAGVRLTFTLFDGLQGRAEGASLGLRSEGL